MTYYMIYYMHVLLPDGVSLVSYTRYCAHLLSRQVSTAIDSTFVSFCKVNVGNCA